MKNTGEILANILLDFKDCILYLHNTRELNVVKKVLDEGFIFESQLSHSTDRVNPNENIEITYFLFQRKDYGSYTIIIAIPKTTHELYARLSSNADIGIEDLLTITQPYTGE